MIITSENGFYTLMFSTFALKNSNSVGGFQPFQFASWIAENYFSWPLESWRTNIKYQASLENVKGLFQTAFYSVLSHVGNGNFQRLFSQMDNFNN